MNHVKCKVVMLPTQKVKFKNSLMYISDIDMLLPFSNDRLEDIINWDYKTLHHLYILSDEEVKVDDWYLCNIKNRESIDKVIHEEYLTKDHKKIIASTDESLGLPRPSDSFIKKYCELGGIEEILVEYNTKIEYVEEFDIEIDDILDYNTNMETLKVAPDNTITIHPSVEKTYTRDQLIGILKDYRNSIMRVGPKEVEYLDNWVKDNL